MFGLTKASTLVIWSKNAQASSCQESIMSTPQVRHIPLRPRAISLILYGGLLTVSVILITSMIYTGQVTSDLSVRILKGLPRSNVTISSTSDSLVLAWLHRPEHLLYQVRTLEDLTRASLPELVRQELLTDIYLYSNDVGYAVIAWGPFNPGFKIIDIKSSNYNTVPDPISIQSPFFNISTDFQRLIAVTSREADNIIAVSLYRTKPERPTRYELNHHYEHYTSNVQGTPSAALDENGYLLLSWLNDDLESIVRGKILSQRFNQLGQPMGPELVISDSANEIKTTALGTSFLVVWRTPLNDEIQASLVSNEEISRSITIAITSTKIYDFWIASKGNHWLTIWLEGEPPEITLRGRFCTAVHCLSPFSVAQSRDNTHPGYASATIIDHNRFAVAWDQDEHPGNSYVSEDQLIGSTLWLRSFHVRPPLQRLTKEQLTFLGSLFFLGLLSTAFFLSVTKRRSR